MSDCQEILIRLRLLLQSSVLQLSDAVKIAFLVRKARELLPVCLELNPKAGRDLNNALRAMETTSKITQENLALYLQALDKLDIACAARRGRVKTRNLRMAMKREENPSQYLRLVLKEEFERLLKSEQLNSIESDELIPAIVAPDAVAAKVMEMSEKDIRDLYVRIGGAGKVDFVVVFETHVIPKAVLPIRHAPNLREAKFLDQTPIRLIRIRTL